MASIIIVVICAILCGQIHANAVMDSSRENAVPRAIATQRSLLEEQGQGHTNKQLQTGEAADSDANVIHMIVSYPWVLDSIGPTFPQNLTREQVAARQAEFTDTVYRNLMHPRVATIHVIYEHPDHLSFLIHDMLHRTRKEGIQIVEPELRNDKIEMTPKDADVVQADYTLMLAILRAKLHGWHLPRKMFYADAFSYANKHLAGKIVYVGNGDIIIGAGWEEISAEKMKNENKVYSLTRRHVCPGKVEGCELQAKWGGSDCFVFVSPINNDVVTNTDHPTNDWGAENNVLYHLQRAGYRILNPCEKLATFHNHCSEYRPNISKTRVNNFGPNRGSGVASLSKEL